MSVPTVDEDAWRTSSRAPRTRCSGCARSASSSTPASTPACSWRRSFRASPRRATKLERTIKAIADHGARFVGCNVMYLQDGTRTHFMKFIEREFPSMRPRFERLYARKYPPEAYRKEVKAMVRVLQQRYGLDAGARSSGRDAQSAERGPHRSRAGGIRVVSR